MKMQNVIYRQADFLDLESLEQLEISVWGEKMAARRGQWVSRINVFPEGTNVAAADQKLIGAITSHIVKWQAESGCFPSWEEITSDGYITNHDNDGDAMYGVNVSVLPGWPQVAENLIKRNLEIARRRNIRTIFGCRLPTLARRIKQADQDAVESLGRNSFLADCASRDPEVKFFMMKFGFKIIGFKENYFAKDSDSLGWGVILELK